MKALLTLAMTLVIVGGAHGQGTVTFSNGGGPPVYICDQNALYPAPLGPAFQVALYYAPDGVMNEAAFLQLGNAAGFGPSPGYFSGGGRTAPTTIPGDWAMFQVRGWEGVFGSTYEEAALNPQARLGKSNIFRVDTTDPESTGPPASLVTYGFQSFVIASPTCIPEPHLTRSMLVISALVLALRLCRRRRTIGL